MNNDDYEWVWVFKDDRFCLSNGNYEYLLKFLCEIFDPSVRIEKTDWKSILEKKNKMLSPDGLSLLQI